MPIATPDAVIIGSEVAAGAWLPEARQFVGRNWLRLAGVPTWLFSSGAQASSYRNTAAVHAWAGEIAAELALVSEAQCFA